MIGWVLSDLFRLQTPHAMTSCSQLLTPEGYPSAEFSSILQQIFQRFDVDRDGFLNLKEVNALNAMVGSPALSMDEFVGVLFCYDDGNMYGLSLQGFQASAVAATLADPKKEQADLLKLGFVVPDSALPPAMTEADYRAAAAAQAASHNLTMNILNSFPSGDIGSYTVCSYCGCEVAGSYCTNCYCTGYI